MIRFGKYIEELDGIKKIGVAFDRIIQGSRIVLLFNRHYFSWQKD